jgi:prevent-host-death family protein
MVMKRTKVAELKAHLSDYLASVRAGDTVLVCDRNTPIARIVPYDERDDGFVVHEAQRPSELHAVRGVRPRGRVDVVRMLRDDRGQR